MDISERVALIKRLAEEMAKEDYDEIDLALEQFGFPTSNSWTGHVRGYVLAMLKEGTDPALEALGRHYNLIARATSDSSGTDDDERIWKPGMFRLFISHVVSQKHLAAELRNALLSHEISAFVAHEDIHPSLEWQREIESALRSMEALVALVSPDFHASQWTDQEVGFGLARRVLVLSVRLGADPYGFFARNQAIPGFGQDAWKIAQSIVDALTLNPLTQSRLADSAIRQFAGSGSFRGAEANAQRLLQFRTLSADQLRAIEQACLDNMEIFASFGCPGLLETLYRKHRWTPTELPPDWSLNLAQTTGP